MKPWEQAAAQITGAPPAPVVTDPAATQSQPSGAASTGGGQIGAGAIAATSNGAMVGVVGPEIPPITLGINAIVERLKHWSKFDEDYAFHYVCALWLIVAVAWGFIKSDPLHSITMLFGGIGNSHLTHEGLRASGTGIIKPVPPEKRYVRHSKRSMKPFFIAALVLGGIVLLSTIVGTWALVSYLDGR